ncbi:uroporphyrinogen-III synthase [Homoserinimonas aerilata]|uniref:Uroporphyrinogen-III synthase n=1 Tax=Homoserinimonas aerilata TaxID=1162970 RepID=A0A542YJC1_9MICO|nr:uroporphyrinogen-III synthase [Homoserinimonas aerilata]TQL48074.1 uroporphyrinogen-III synthase [Homoserinimonas aerilata]
MTNHALLHGRHVLVPRGGELGERLASLLREAGATVTTAPLIRFTAAENPSAVAAALERLAEGRYDWLTVTSATTVTVLSEGDAVIPATTRVAAVGEATASALRGAGHRVDFVPEHDGSAAGMLREWPGGGASALLLQSAIAAPTLAEGLAALGLAVDVVAAYRTLPVDAPRDVVDAAHAGLFDAILLTSASVARQVARQLHPLPVSTLLVCIGAPTAQAASEAGLSVAAIATRSSAEALVDAVADALTHNLPEHDS